MWPMCHNLFSQKLICFQFYRTDVIHDRATVCTYWYIFTSIWPNLWSPNRNSCGDPPNIGHDLSHNITLLRPPTALLHPSRGECIGCHSLTFATNVHVFVTRCEILQWIRPLDSTVEKLLGIVSMVYQQIGAGKHSTCTKWDQLMGIKYNNCESV